MTPVSPMTPGPRIAAAVAAAALLSTVFAAPAAAEDDQQLAITSTGCWAGYQATGLYDTIHTDRVQLAYDEATNSVTATCTFKRIPGKVKAGRTHDGSEDWRRPKARTTVGVAPCGLHGPEYASLPHYDEGYGIHTGGTLTYTVGSTAVATCTFDLDG